MKRYRLKTWVKVVIAIILFITVISIQYNIKVNRSSKKIIVKTEIKKQKNLRKTELEIAQAELEEKEVEQETINNSYTTRLTSYYANDGYETGSCTGSGLCESDFQVNEYGWYTYQGKLVVATATEYLLKYGFGLYEGVHTYRYYDEIILNIDGIDYEAIVLDSCGSSMKTDRIDLFVSNGNSVKDTIVKVRINNNG